MKLATACTSCRDRKVKCVLSWTDPYICENCLIRKSTCSIAQERATKLRKQSTWKTESTPSVRTLTSTVTTRVQFVQDYIYNIHDRPHSLFHEPTLQREARSGTLDLALLHAICALSCRFSAEPRFRGLCSAFYHRANAIFNEDMEQISLTSLQTCLLLANIASAEARKNSEALHLSMAVRLAQLLKLDVPQPDESRVLQETKRRVLLSLFMNDRWASNGSDLPLLFDFDVIPAHDVAPEWLFHTDTFAQAVSPSQVPGLWTYRTDLAVILGAIHACNRRLVKYGIPDHAVDAGVDELASSLRNWEDSLPEEVRYNATNLDFYRSHSLGGSFIDLFLGYHYYAMLLFFQYLGKQNPNRGGSLHLYATHCRKHALTFSTLLSTSRRLPGCRAVHGTVGHMAVISSSVLIYFLLSELEDDKNSLRAALVANFEAIKELESYWPNLTQWTKRLSTFQQACHNWPVKVAFRMDDWMLRFLAQYALPLPNKDERWIDLPPAEVSSSFLTIALARKEDYVSRTLTEIASSEGVLRHS